MTTLFQEAQKLGIKNKRLLSIAGRVVLEWYRQHSPQAIQKTLSTEYIAGKESTFTVIGYPDKEAGRIQLMILEVQKHRRNEYKGKNNNRGHKRPRVKKSIR